MQDTYTTLTGIHADYEKASTAQLFDEEGKIKQQEMREQYAVLMMLMLRQMVYFQSIGVSPESFVSNLMKDAILNVHRPDNETPDERH